MRLLFLDPANLRTGRGTENLIFNLLKFRPDFVDCTIIHTDRYDIYRLSENDVAKLTKSCKIIQINSVPRTNNIFRFLYQMFWKKSLLKAKIDQSIFNQIDVVYLLDNDYAAIIENQKNIPIIGSQIISYGKPFIKHYFPYTYYYKLYLKNINGFHAFPHAKNILEMHSFKYSMVLPLGVDTKLFYPCYQLANKKLKFLFVASLDNSKGLDILLPLIDKLNDNDEIEFHIAGSGPLVKKVKKRNKVIYHGVLNNEALAALYRKCDIFIYPSHNDNYSLVTLQALSSGLYVLAGDYLRGIFDDFNQYLEYIPMNIKSFYKRILQIVKNRKIIEHNKRDEYIYVQEHYDWGIISKKFYDYMEKFYQESIIDPVIEPVKFRQHEH